MHACLLVACGVLHSRASKAAPETPTPNKKDRKERKELDVALMKAWKLKTRYNEVSSLCSSFRQQVASDDAYSWCRNDTLLLPAENAQANLEAVAQSSFSLELLSASTPQELKKTDDEQKLLVDLTDFVLKMEPAIHELNNQVHMLRRMHKVRKV